MVNNRLCFGDNLEVLRERIASESVDLIYLDPPFKSNATYNLLFATQDGRRAPAQIQAFGDTWRWDEAAVLAYHTVLSHGGAVAEGTRALHMMLGDSDLMAYLAMMGIRLVELHRVLKPTGSLYLHCDPTASHYLKMLLDAVFTPQRFLNEITWKRTHSHGNVGRNFGAVCDTLLVYTKTADYTWVQRYTPFDEAYIAATFDRVDPDGRRWQSVTLRNPGQRPNLRFPYTASNGVTYQPHPNGWSCDRERLERYDREGRLHFPAKPTGALRLKMYLDESPGVKLQNLWDDIPAIGSRAAERLGYPTQKPLALLERIISVSSNPSDVVLDPFCGCGTAIDAAQALGRHWWGIDITHLAIDLVTKRLRDRYPSLIIPPIEREPTTFDGAEELARTDPHGFQDWICAKVGGQRTHLSHGLSPRVAHKKGADRGIDGRLYFVDDASNTAKQIVLSVKAGHLQPAYVRELRGVMEREGAEMAALLTLHEPTAAMKREALNAGVYTSPGWNKAYHRLQIVTVTDLFRVGASTTHPQLRRTSPTGARNGHAQWVEKRSPCPYRR